MAARRSFTEIDWLSVLILAPIFWFLPFDNILYCIFVGSFTIICLMFQWRNLKIRLDPFFYWLIFFFSFCLLVSLLSGAGSLNLVANLIYVFIIISFILLRSIGKEEVVILCFITVITYFLPRIISGFLEGGISGVFTHIDVTGARVLTPQDNAKASIIAVVVFLLFKSKDTKIALLLSLLSLVLFMRTAYLGFLLILLLNFLKIDQWKTKYRRTALLSFIILATMIPFTIGKYFGDNTFLSLASNYRSHFYGVLVEDIENRGSNILLPISDNYANQLLTQDLKSGYFSGSDDFISMAADKLSYLTQRQSYQQCPHSTFLEYLVNFGLIIFLMLFLSFLWVESTATILILIYFITVISLQCEVFFPTFFIPYYLVYRSKYLNENSWT